MAGDADVVIQHEQIVTFEDEGTVEESTLALPAPMPEHLGSSATENRDHDIKDFISRPLLLRNFTWASTADPGTDLFVVNYPNDLFQQKTIWEKISGFTWFKGDMVIRINVNAQKFQQGFLLLYFVPYRFLLGGAPPTDHLTTKTGYPHVVMNLAESQSITLRVPFVAPMSHLNIVREQWAIGTVVCSVYGKLAGGDTEIGGSVWGHFENVELSLPTGVEPYIAPVLNTSSFILSTEAQMGKVDLKAEKKEGFISGAAAVVGKISKVATMIPGLGTIAAPVAAVAGVVGNIASAFGFSKPTSEKLPEPYQVQTARNVCHFNGGDLSKKLTLDATNSIGTDPIFGSGVDEMSLAYIAGTMNYYASFDFEKTMPAGRLLYFTSVCPLGERKQYKNYKNTWVFTHLAFIARMFAYWSGGIKYRFRFVKTKFHSGRLRVTIVPQGIFNGSLASIDVNKCISYIIDLKEKSEFEFTVPYSFNSPVFPTGFKQSNFGFGVNGTTMPAPAVLIVTVLNELRTPSTLVSDTVNVIVEKGGADDISFYCPLDVEGDIVMGDDGAPPTLVAPLQPMQTTIAQSATREEDQLGQDSSVPLFSVGGSFDTRLPLSCVGETTVSARQLLKRFQTVALFTETAIDILPYAPIGYHMSSTPHETGDYTDFYSAFTSIFAFMRGSMRLKVLYETTANLNGTHDHFLLTNRQDQGATNTNSPAFYYPSTFADQLPYRPEVIGNPLRDGIFEIEVPYYNQYSMTPTAKSSIDPIFNTRDNMNFPSNTSVATYQCNSAFTAPKSIMRAVGEDFSFGFLIGVPPIQD